MSITIRVGPQPPICRKCGHEACPICPSWCDVILEDGTPCCDSECEFDKKELEAYQGWYDEEGEEDDEDD